MSSRKRAKKDNDNDALLRGLNSLRDEIRKIHGKKDEQSTEKEDELEVVVEETTLENQMHKLQGEVRAVKESIKEVKSFIFENTTGAVAFINQAQIREAMLDETTAENWKSKQIDDFPSAFATVQRALNEEKEFDAAKEMQGIIEVAEVVREINLVNPTAAPWLKKGMDEAIGVVLRMGKERKGQSIFWGCLAKHLIKRFAEKEKDDKAAKTKPVEPPKEKKAEYPCPNCIKSGKPNMMHTLADCARMGNPCKLECRSCPCEPGTNNYPCHWNSSCPNARKRDRSSSSRNPGYFRG